MWSECKKNIKRYSKQWWWLKQKKNTRLTDKQGYENKRKSKRKIQYKIQLMVTNVKFLAFFKRNCDIVMK